MNNAEKVVAKFGGQTALAKLLGKTQSTIQHWCKAGNIPAKWQSKLLELAETSSIDLSPSDLVLNEEAISIEPPKDKIPEATFSGSVSIGEVELPCYVLSDGRRVISRTGATAMLTSAKGGGNLESYTRVEALQGYLPADLPMIEFSMPGVVNKTVLGMSAETFLDICKAYVTARESASAKMTERQVKIAIQANMFLVACSKIGLIALIDEATGYQYERADDALRFKLKVYLEEEMRKWEKTFPDELWREFGRLTNWKGGLHQRPKYWGKLVMELVYGYLDKDVAEWLKSNAPKPRGGQNYHQWLSSQYGLKKLVEHLWMLVGMASACTSMSELREKMAERFGRVPVQLRLFLPPTPSKMPRGTGV
jgi:hypothetical protein